MQLKTILVCLTTKEHSETLMKVAVPLARKHGAHLVGLHSIEALIVYPGIAMHVPEPAFAVFNENQDKEAEAIKGVFDKFTRNEDFPSEWRLVRAESTTAVDRMVESAHAADLIIMAHEDAETDRFDQKQAQIEVIRHSGRPVVIVPLNYDGPEIGRNIVLGWSNTREAARAAHDLLAVAEQDADVTVLHVDGANRNEMADFDAIDLAGMFSRHGLRATIVQRSAAGRNVAEVLNVEAFERGADLIVTGAFGHSRVYDFVIGAATHALLRDAKLPVMFSK